MQWEHEPHWVVFLKKSTGLANQIKEKKSVCNKFCNLIVSIKLVLTVYVVCFHCTAIA